MKEWFERLAALPAWQEVKAIVRAGEAETQRQIGGVEEAAKIEATQKVEAQTQGEAMAAK